MECVDCGKETRVIYGHEALCSDCVKKRYENQVLEQSKSVSSCEQFKTWSGKDLSELFWIHLGRYIKNPNPESLDKMYMAFLWACHDNHALMNSFRHALEWANIDIYSELERWRA